MEIKLKPFDFAQAVARAGLRPDGEPLARAGTPAEGASFKSAMAQALQQLEHGTRGGGRALRYGKCGRCGFGGGAIHKSVVHGNQRVVNKVGGVGLLKKGTRFRNRRSACQWMRATTPKVMAG